MKEYRIEIKASTINTANWRVGWIVADTLSGNQWEIIDHVDGLVQLRLLPSDERVQPSLVAALFIVYAHQVGDIPPAQKA